MLPLFFLYASLVNDIRGLIAQNDLASAARAAQAYQAQRGATPELAAAISWIARGQFAANKLDEADRLAGEARQLSAKLLGIRRLDSDPWLPTALGAGIEVHSQVLAARGERADAVGFLREQLAMYGGTSIGERIRKNLNLLNMEGKPAPPLEIAQWLGEKPPTLASLRGHPVLLFFWAHWCSDCKAETAIIADLRKTYGPKGLAVIGPTRLYGYAAGGEEATPAAEKQYIEKIRQQYYGVLSGMPVPVSSGNFLTYGASSTPTLVLIDAAGIVRYYHPGAASESELAGKIQKMLVR